MGCEGAIIHRDLENREGRTPKTLVFSHFLAFDGSSRQLRRTSEGADAARRLFDGSAQEIYFTSVRLQRKQKRRILFTFGMSCPRDHRKRQSERSPAGAVSIALKDHRLPENVNIEKVGPTFSICSDCNLIFSPNLDHGLQTLSKGDVTTAFCKMRW